MLSYGGKTYTYTTNGELLTKTSNGQTTTYHYDVLGNLRQIQLPEKTIEYVIDGRNRRVGKKVNGTLVQGFLYQGSLKPVAELDGNGNVVARFVYGSKANVPDYLVKDGKSYRLLSDHLGSPRLVVDLSDGSVVQRLEYDAFGNITLDTSPNFQPFGFAGGLYDMDTQLVRFGARDYDAAVGRWMSKDSTGFGGGDNNFYSYSGNSPVSFLDLTGKETSFENVINCTSDCIQSIDPLNDYGKTAISVVGTPLPKSVLGMPTIGNASPYTNLPSYLSLGHGTAASGRNLIRMGGRIATPMWITYGICMVAVEGYCTYQCTK